MAPRRCHGSGLWLSGTAVTQLLLLGVPSVLTHGSSLKHGMLDAKQLILCLHVAYELYACCLLRIHACDFLAQKGDLLEKENNPVAAEWTRARGSCYIVWN